MSVSRRRFLALGGGLSLGAMLGVAGCGDSSESGSSSTLTVLLPGEVPAGWDPVLEAVNQKLQADLGFTVAPQFIAWANYAEQALLKFTAGENFDTALQARWLNLTQLVADGAVIAVDDLLNSGDYPNLTATLDPTLLDLNRWSGTLYGLPQVNSAARLHHFTIRQDLAEKYGFDAITDYETLERYWYAVREGESDVIPVAISSNMPDLLVAAPGSVGWLNQYSWENPHVSGATFTGNSLPFIMATDAAQTGLSRPAPFWEAEGMVDALHAIRRYYEDGIINHDALNLDSSTLGSQFESGRYATRWAMTDGLSSQSALPLSQAVPGATLANVMPIAAGVKPNQTFQADNFVVLNAKGSSNERAMQLEDWLSIKENHDLISYGIEGKDWNPVGDDRYEQLSTYSFPGYALCWRAGLERKLGNMSETEAAIFEWAQSYDNFTVDTFASFVPDPAPVERENTQVTAAMTQYGNPLLVGAVDVDKGLDDLKQALAGAGMDKLQAEMEKQADAYLASQ